MPKKKFLVKEAGLVDFFKSFFNAKANGKEASFIQQIRKQNPELGDVWSDWNDKMDTMLKNTKKDLQLIYGNSSIKFSPVQTIP